MRERERERLTCHQGGEVGRAQEAMWRVVVEPWIDRAVGWVLQGRRWGAFVEEEKMVRKEREWKSEQEKSFPLQRPSTA